jgi:anti-anti-sigma factor
MEIKQIQTGDTIVLKIAGKLTAVAEEAFCGVIDDALTKTNRLVLDFQDVSYVASAGLRVLVSTRKKITALQGSLVLRNLKDDILEVFRITGLDTILTIE